MLVVVSSLNLTQSKGWLCKLELYTGHESQSLCSWYQFILFENGHNLLNLSALSWYSIIIVLFRYTITQGHR